MTDRSLQVTDTLAMLVKKTSAHTSSLQRYCLIGKFSTLNTTSCSKTPHYMLLAGKLLPQEKQSWIRLPCPCIPWPSQSACKAPPTRLMLNLCKLPPPTSQSLLGESTHICLPLRSHENLLIGFLVVDKTNWLSLDIFWWQMQICFAQYTCIQRVTWPLCFLIPALVQVLRFVQACTAYLIFHLLAKLETTT